MATWLDLEGELNQEYAERFHEDSDVYKPDRFEEELSGMDNDEVLELYNDWFGTELTLEDIDD